MKLNNKIMKSMNESASKGMDALLSELRSVARMCENIQKNQVEFEKYLKDIQKEITTIKGKINPIEKFIYGVQE